MHEEQLAARLRRLLASKDREAVECSRLARLMALIALRPPPPDPGGHFPSYAELREKFFAAVEEGPFELIEERFLELYAHLHMHEAPYTPEERRRLDDAGGYWGHAGGLSPILEAGDWIGADTVSADLGAGNGLQLLLMQALYPHARSVQIEISREMLEIGRRLQQWLEIPGDRVQWIVGDVREASVRGIDFLYLYRPVRPVGPGRAFYERVASELDQASKVVVFSIADCLRDFVSESFRVYHYDGHLTILGKSNGGD